MGKVRMRNRTGRSLTVAGLAITAGGLSMVGQAAAAAPPAIPNFAAPTAFVRTSTPNAAIPDNTPAGLSSVITVAGAPAKLTDVDITTFIEHTWSGDLDITITPPQGTTVLLRGQTDTPLPDPVYQQGENDPGVVWDRNNVFNGTIWDDQAPKEATETLYQNDVAEATLVPEGALGAFIGQNPNGNWTLKVVDTRSSEVDPALDSGKLTRWQLNLRGQDSLPASTTTTVSGSPAAAIPDGPGGAAVSRTLTVAGAAAYLTDVNLTTVLPHADSSDLDVTLKSPKGTTVTITTDNGKDDANLFNGTLWDDSFTGSPFLVTPRLAPRTDGNVMPKLVPEGALAAFIGENPNGVWTLTAKDDAAGGLGSLASWQLDIAATAGGTVAPPTPDPVIPTPPAPLPPVVVTKLAPKSLSLASSTTRDRKAPFTFGVSGSLARPAGTICQGKVKVTAKAGKKVVATRVAGLKAKGATCKFAASFRFAKRPATLPKSGKIVLSARFLGSTTLLPKASATKTVRLG
jgi:subtilisin-like proprotein convertase family protein